MHKQKNENMNRVLRNYLFYFLVSFLLISLVLYFFTIKEGFKVKNIKDGYFYNIPATIEYFFYWVLPNWWFFILVASIIMTFKINRYLIKR